MGFCVYSHFLKLTNMTLIQTSPVWYGGGMRKHRNASLSVGHLTYTGFIFPKLTSYE